MLVLEDELRADPDVKKRRIYKDMVSFECFLECIMHEYDKRHENDPQEKNSQRSSSMQQKKRVMNATAISKLNAKRHGTPDQVNISI